MTRLDDIRQRVEAAEYVCTKCGWFGKTAEHHGTESVRCGYLAVQMVGMTNAEARRLLDLVERAVPYMEQAAGADPHWDEQHYTAHLWLRDVRGKK